MKILAARHRETYIFSISFCFFTKSESRYFYDVRTCIFHVHVHYVMKKRRLIYESSIFAVRYINIHFVHCLHWSDFVAIVLMKSINHLFYLHFMVVFSQFVRPTICLLLNFIVPDLNTCMKVCMAQQYCTACLNILCIMVSTENQVLLAGF